MYWIPTFTLERSPFSVRSPGVEATSNRAEAKLDVVALLLDLVRPLAEHRVERLGRHRHGVRVGDPGAVEAALGLALLVVRTASNALRLASSSVRDGITAAIPPIACAPRAWQVFTTSSLYAS